MGRTVRYNSQHDLWYFGDELRSSDGADSLVIKRNDLKSATATDLANALRSARQHDAGPEAVLIDLAPDDQYSPKESAVDGTSFVLLDDGRLAIRVSLASDEYMADDDHLRAIVTPLFAPLLNRAKAGLVNVSADDYRSTAPFFHEAILTVNLRGKKLDQLYALAESVMALFDAATAGQLTRDTVANIVLGGRADLLIGLREGPWLDVKSDHYGLKTMQGTISLAAAVARFCNAEEGGVVVVGMETKSIPGGEIIKSLKPVPIDTKTVRSYRQTIETRLFPFPTGMTIETVQTGQGLGLVVISIPPQEEELKPFLIHGAIVDGVVEGAFISIVRRSGEDSIPITAQQIHSTLAAGRALLRRGQLP